MLFFLLVIIGDLRLALKGKAREWLPERNHFSEHEDLLVGGERFSSAGGLGRGPELCFSVHFFTMMLTLYYVTRKQIPTIFDIFDQGSANYSSWARCGPAPVFVWWRCIGAQPHPLVYIFCGCFVLPWLSSYDGDYIHEPRIFTTWPFVRKVYRPLF